MPSSSDWFPDDWSLDQQMLVDCGQRIQKIKMWPYMDVPNYILSAMVVRDDLGPGGIQFARQHPFSCWLSTMIIVNAGTVLANVLLGEPPIAPFHNHGDILAATFFWYFVFYSPFDVVYKLAKWFPIKVALSVMKEVQRAYKVDQGVAHARKHYPESYLVQTLVGISKGAGAGIVKVFEQFLRGVWQPTGHEILRPSFTTKACVIASTILVVERNTNLITAPHDVIYLSIVGFFVYFKLSALLLDVKDPLAPIENIICAVFMGGIWEAFSRAIESTKDEVKGSGGKNADEDFMNNNVNVKKNGNGKKEGKKNK